MNTSKVFRAMFAKAKELGVEKGVAVILKCGNQQTMYFRVHESGVDGSKQTNYHAYAAGKALFSSRLGEPSGTKGFETLRGESDARGSVLSEDLMWVFAYSGGTEDEDVLIAQAGADAYNAQE